MMNTRKARVGFLVLLFFLASSAPVAFGGDARPNFVVILLDDIDFDEISPYDYRNTPTYSGARRAGAFPRHEKSASLIRLNPAPNFLTPAIDSLAREGATFNRFYVTSPACTPSRYSLLTGRYATRSPEVLAESRVDEPINVSFNTLLGTAETNLVRDLGNLGYTTGIVGKWHNGPEGGRGHLAPGQIRLDSRPDDPEMLTQARAVYEDGRRYLLDRIGFDYAERLYFGNIKDLNLPEALSYDNLEWVTEGALNFIEDYGHAGPPFFLYVALSVPHGQAQARPSWLQRIVNGEKRSKPLRSDPLATPIGLLDSVPNVMPERGSLTKRLAATGATQGAGAEEILWMDDSIHAILDALDTASLRDNTIVLVFSDHQSRGKLSVYEGARVPAFIRWPGKVEPGRRIDSLFANIDVAPTFLRIAGASDIAAGAEADGLDLTSVLLGASSGDRQSVLLEATYQRALVNDRFKLVVTLDAEWLDQALQGSDEILEEGSHFNLVSKFSDDFPAASDEVQLYDLRDDVFEQKNLINEPEFQSNAKTLGRELRAMLSRLPHHEERFLPDRAEFAGPETHTGARSVANAGAPH